VVSSGNWPLEKRVDQSSGDELLQRVVVSSGNWPLGKGWIRVLEISYYSGWW